MNVQMSLPGFSYDPLNALQVTTLSVPVNLIRLTDVPVSKALKMRLARVGQVSELPIVKFEKDGTYTPIWGAVFVEAFRQMGVDPKYMAFVQFDLDNITVRELADWNIPPEVLNLIAADEGTREDAHQFRSVQSLLAQGYTLSQISEETGIGIGKLKNLFKTYGAMDDILLQAIATQQITKSTAKKITHLPKDISEEVRAQLEAGEKIGEKALKEIKVQVRQAANQRASLRQMAAFVSGPATNSTVEPEQFYVLNGALANSFGSLEDAEAEAMSMRSIHGGTWIVVKEV